LLEINFISVDAAAPPEGEIWWVFEGEVVVVVVIPEEELGRPLVIEVVLRAWSLPLLTMLFKW
jgi:hypothetical protein